MSKDDVIRMGRMVFDVETDSRGRETFSTDNYGLERFAALVAAAKEQEMLERIRHIIVQAEERGAAAEREACAKVCDVTPPYPFRPSIEAAHAIRARGQR